MCSASTLERGRESYERRAWQEAFAHLTAADRATPLEPQDLERVATAAHLLGRDDDSDTWWERAHHELLAGGDVARAARCAFWLAYGLFLRGEQARSRGWAARARRLLADGRPDCVEQGYLLELQNLDEGDPGTAYAASTRAAGIGERFRDPDLTVIARLGQAEAQVRLGRIADAVPLLDEVMVSVTAGDVSPIVVGIVSCAAIETCQAILDLSRARAWTAALTRWCDAQPDLVPYRGQCLVHRSEILQLHGAWPEAFDAAQQAYDRFSQRSTDPAIGAACYRQGELRRLRGEFAAAEESYRQATRWGREPQPGLALLRLTQGQLDAAAAAMRRALGEARHAIARSRLLPAYVEVMLRAEDISAARTGAEELSRIAGEFDAPVLRAQAAQAAGAVDLADGDAHAALGTLRHAWRLWRELDVPYEGARVRVLLGLACRKLGDHDSAEMELDAARWVFRQFGAEPDVAEVDALLGPPSSAAGRLTAREREVLRLVAAGKSNRAIAADLLLSEHTVARHVQNIFSKLDVGSRTAAAAFAFEHHLV